MRAKGVPFGVWGTVVACHSHSACVEVVFDEEFIGGGTLHGMCSNYRYCCMATILRRFFSVRYG
ncbi:unnamed protein product, partial [Ectocarpus sp. 8 AP-2014]